MHPIQADPTPSEAHDNSTQHDAPSGGEPERSAADLNELTDLDESEEEPENDDPGQAQENVMTMETNERIRQAQFAENGWRQIMQFLMETSL